MTRGRGTALLKSPPPAPNSRPRAAPATRGSPTRRRAAMFHTAYGPADVLGELNRLQDTLDRVFRPLERSSIRASTGSSFPVINVGATADSIEIMAMAPGVDPGALQVTVDRGLLVIAGERKVERPERGRD